MGQTTRTMNRKAPAQFAALLAAERLPASYRDFARRWIEPLADWLLTEVRRHGDAPLLVGVNGAQGTGKTTLCKFLRELLEPEIATVTLALDDFYLEHAARQRLAEQVHPLLATRGVPGTHDITLLQTTLEQLLAGTAASWPRFDKAADDRLPEAVWPRSEAPVALVLLEGWCIGCPPQPQALLEQPVNRLEAGEDGDGRWRRHVNAVLADQYAQVFAGLQRLIVLQAPSLAAVRRWRALQERKLAQREPGRTMDRARLHRFLQHYERLTNWCLAELPKRADYLLRLDERHQVAEVVLR